VLDLFAGPGGLGEGFSNFQTDGTRPFRLVLSVECDPEAHRTLELRAFYREFLYRGNCLPDEYYTHVRDPNAYTRHELFSAFPAQASAAEFEACHATLGETAGDAVVRDKLRQLKATGIDFSRSVIIGGPPCQAYSLVGRSRRAKAQATGTYSESQDGRHVLYRQYLRLLKELKPAAFVMENVRGMVSATYEGVPIFPRILHDLGAAGYNLHGLGQPCEPSGSPWELMPQDDRLREDAHNFVLQAHRYGVPQRRERVFVVGTRRDLGINSITPLVPDSRVVSVRDAIGDLPKLRAGLSQADSEDAWKALVRSASRRLSTEVKHQNAPLADLLSSIGQPRSRLGGAHGRGGNFVPHESARRDGQQVAGALNHETRGHLPADLERYLFYAAWSRVTGRGETSPTLAHLPSALLPDHSNVRRAVEEGTIGEVAFVDRFRVQTELRPSTTVTAHIAKDGHYYIHFDPRQCRSLTVREAARLQTFPDDYYFCGPRTEQYRQVGNAVPPMLATRIAECVYGVMERVLGL
jgi:DNA (cytosine-5)-methyltransferase 1